MTDLRLPWRIDPDDSRVVRDASDSLVCEIDSGLTYEDDDAIAAAIVKAMNATHRPDCKRCGGVCGNGLAACPVVYANGASTRTAADDAAMMGEPVSVADELRFGVEVIGKEVTWYATLDEAWQAMGPGRRVAKR